MQMKRKRKSKRKKSRPKNQQVALTLLLQAQVFWRISCICADLFPNANGGYLKYFLFLGFHMLRLVFIVSCIKSNKCGVTVFRNNSGMTKTLRSFLMQAKRKRQTQRMEWPASRQPKVKAFSWTNFYACSLAACIYFMYSYFFWFHPKCNP